MSGFDVQFSGLVRAHREMRDVEEALRSANARASEAVGDLTAGGWSGVAARDFAAGWQQWRQGADEVLAALAELSGAIATSAAEYQSTDLAGRARITAASAPTPGSSGLRL